MYIYIYLYIYIYIYTVKPIIITLYFNFTHLALGDDNVYITGADIHSK